MVTHKSNIYATTYPTVMRTLKNGNAMWGQEKLNIVDGSDLLSDQGRDEENIRKWKMRDAKCQYYIVRTIENHVKTHIVICTTAKEMYDTLKKIYQRDTSQQKCIAMAVHTTL
jgi:hypothetical protein